MRITTHPIAWNRLNADGYQAVVIPFTSPQKIVVLSSDARGLLWVPSAFESAGVRVPILKVRAAQTQLANPNLVGFAFKAAAKLPGPLGELHVVFDPADDAAEQHIGIFAVLA